jgi:hypothetical protein
MLTVRDREILRRECLIGELVRHESNVLHEIEGRLVRDSIPAIRGDLTEPVDSESKHSKPAEQACSACLSSSRSQLRVRDKKTHPQLVKRI